MGHSRGLRSGTRYAFSRGFKNHGVIALSTYLKTYRVGDIVDIKVNGAVQKGSRKIPNLWETSAKDPSVYSMPFKVYHGKTGVVYNVTKSAVGVIIYKRVGNRYMEKRVNVRIEHVMHSRSREEFLNRVKENAIKKRKAKDEGIHVHLKRQPVGPRDSRTVSTENNLPETITPVPYETTI
ncbi:60S ribosomal protein L21A [Ophidiomyces ophidiicola]|uniref:60S ribosomal protein L21A n=1 Tax=Ophidiomyces ophidiicola TaxID=1387563 RepID=UPI0020C3771B|nr:60S ribosomal protein L21A [Ophidiomyces ophidiicola]KAI1950382.1 60S ribosomal protein L21A [Ophidiomyces ophidiicola]KAI1981019.1 60S ribosomal protein L21A [Ophidiomyces ophidiicola]KAI1990515.1 60S ribosomal protein L21A [Ophidiomyces ophidiicola]KAI1994331.1 60S ribosomal protein L21A [Ophidiomyces ophidiicola]KAI1995024.1 60S ribosomal protein L21A [Ophidiomyces ophidiicola]